MVLKYDIYHFYSSNPKSDEVYGEKFKSVETSNSEVIEGFSNTGKLYIGASLAGCKVTCIEE